VSHDNKSSSELGERGGLGMGEDRWIICISKASCSELGIPRFLLHSRCVYLRRLFVSFGCMILHR
jgi:hypothetical protein